MWEPSGKWPLQTVKHWGDKWITLSAVQGEGMFQEISVCLFFFFNVNVYCILLEGKIWRLQNSTVHGKNALFLVTQESAPLIPERVAPAPPVLQELLGYPRPKWPFPLSCYRVTKLVYYSLSKIKWEEENNINDNKKGTSVHDGDQKKTLKLLCQFSFNCWRRISEHNLPHIIPFIFW